MARGGEGREGEEREEMGGSRDGRGERREGEGRERRGEGAEMGESRKRRREIGEGREG